MKQHKTLAKVANAMLWILWVGISAALVLVPLYFVGFHYLLPLGRIWDHTHPYRHHGMNPYYAWMDAVIFVWPLVSLMGVGVMYQFYNKCRKAVVNWLEKKNG